MTYEVLEKANKELKTIDVKGKAYVQVNERIKAFRKYLPDFALETEVIRLDDTNCTLKAIIKDEKGRVVATGLANETNGSTYINKTSYVENAETSAWGRALANLGIGIDGSMCSAEELVNAINNQNSEEPKEEKKTVEKITKVQDDKILKLLAQLNQVEKLRDDIKNFGKDNLGDLTKEEADKYIKVLNKRLKDKEEAVNGK